MAEPVQVSLSVSHQPSPKSLPALPAEMRNVLYEMILAVSKDTDARGEHPGLSLTQVCRQIRFEFRPLYLEHTLIQIHVNALETYFTAFYGISPFNPAIVMDMKEARGNILIDYTPSTASEVDTASFNIVHLLRLCITGDGNSSLKIRFCCQKSMEKPSPFLDIDRELRSGISRMLSSASVEHVSVNIKKRYIKVMFCGERNRPWLRLLWRQTIHRISDFRAI